MVTGETGSSSQLRLTDAAVAVLGEPGVLDIPSCCADRSDLVTKLRGQLDRDGALLPLQLSWDEVRAWLACAEQLGDGNESASCRADDDTLLRALKAADFLEDEATHGAVADALGRALVGDTMQTGHATEDQCARAHQIVGALQASVVLEILGRLHRRNCVSTTSSTAPREHRIGFQPRFPDIFEDLVAALLQLLPHSHHPAIVQACCLLPDDPQTCVISSASATPAGHMIWAKVIAATHEQVFQRVAAAAPLAGGSYELACAAPSGAGSGAAHEWPSRYTQDCWCHTEDFAELQGSPLPVGTLAGSIPAARSEIRADHVQSDQFRPIAAERGENSERVDCGALGGNEDDAKPRQCDLAVAAGGAATAAAEMGRVWRSAAGGLTRLQLAVVEVPQDRAPRWCTALAQLRMLRALVVDVHGTPPGFPVCEFTAALQRLPALVDLCVAFLDNAGDEERTAPMLSPGPRRLLEGVVTLTQLSSLELDGFYASSPCMSGEECVCTPPVMAQLSQLSRLTCLRFAGMTVASHCTRALADAVKNLPALQELHICFCADIPLEGVALYNAEAVVQRAEADRGLLPSLFQGPGLSSLKHLELTWFSIRVSSYRVALDLPAFHERLRRHSAALLSRLTSLCLGPGLFHLRAVGNEVASLVADMPALQSLSLRCLCINRNHDVAFQLADAPGLAAMPALGAPGCRVSGPGVFAVLNALVQSATSREALRELDISSNCIGQEHAEALAQLLRPLSGLEKLVIRDMSLGLEGPEVVLKAVATLPRLRVLIA